MKYLNGYPETVVQQARQLLQDGRLNSYFAKRYPEQHQVTNDKALFELVMSYKNRYIKKSPPLSKACFDKKIRRVDQALGTHTRVSRIHGQRMQAKKEIRIASLFRHAPLGLLEMIVVHELAHIKENEHDKAFYALCCHMLPDYHQREFDTRLYLHWLDEQQSKNA
ncbi:M48 family metallopeptidase [Thaumasiovibrio sp. DFM-14]|uniref:M48 metallopeptidase family protein n=1 Tax=Thaumasiovibrio sp. DFM-14 TaxID=3384792 RepID=UPI0039A0A926